MSRTLHLGLLFALLCAAVSSCISPPDYPDAPRIKFKELEVVRLPRSDPREQAIDSDTITISFEDGDGDLGLNPTDNMAPYNDVSVNGKQTNPNYFNYYIQAQLKNRNGQFVDYILDGSNGEVGQYNGRFPRLTTEATKEGPLKGNLRYNLGLSLGTPFNPGDEIRFRISIRDRALNLSNEIFTESYVVKP
ncbi:hypothetical protein [Hymenobacter sp. YC55]|uniref:hypothetical protein n=1 Tax=Hymenobacter sp. YC55 TaxID=3034019 RepID=UPI0023F6C73A|nr:hypothetical protein [Hymenobacter sp. YC55]MDF7810977.1 hypothetical protein [Hymenobacter sp. YC55]